MIGGHVDVDKVFKVDDEELKAQLNDINSVQNLDRWDHNLQNKKCKRYHDIEPYSSSHIS